MCVQNFIKLCAAVHDVSTVRKILNNSIKTLIANISGMDQAIDKRKTALLTTIFVNIGRIQFGELWFTNEKNDHDHLNLIFNRVHAVVQVHVHAKYHQAKCSGS